MAQIKCHGCLRQFDENDARWVRPFEGGVSEGAVMHIYSGIYQKAVAGGEPYCPECLPNLLEGDEKDCERCGHISVFEIRPIKRAQPSQVGDFIPPEAQYESGPGWKCTVCDHFHPFKP